MSQLMSPSGQSGQPGQPGQPGQLVQLGQPTQPALDDKRIISLYWSITETLAFPHLLQKFGLNWDRIAEELATKLVTMVRNYFQRNSGKYGWGPLVDLVNKGMAVDITQFQKLAGPPAQDAYAQARAHPPVFLAPPPPSSRFNIHSLLSDEPSYPVRPVQPTLATQLAPVVPLVLAPVQTAPAPMLALALTQLVPTQPPMRLSIMSLLNLELAPAHTNKLLDLLNKPAPAPAKTTPKLADLLSAD